jgi:hypothetical protein
MPVYGSAHYLIDLTNPRMLQLINSKNPHILQHYHGSTLKPQIQGWPNRILLIGPKFGVGSLAVKALQIFPS